MNYIKLLKLVQKNSTRNVLIDFINIYEFAKSQFANPGDTFEFDEIIKHYDINDVIRLARCAKTVFNGYDEKSKLLFLNRMINDEYKQNYDKAEGFIIGKFS